MHQFNELRLRPLSVFTHKHSASSVKELNFRQRCVKPLYYHYTNRGNLMDTLGVEPANPPCKGGIAPRDLRPIKLVELRRIELRYSACKADVIAIIL